jgi:hypothetical protein
MADAHKRHFDGTSGGRTARKRPEEVRAGTRSTESLVYLNPVRSALEILAPTLSGLRYV